MKILLLGQTGSGKSFSLFPNKELNHKGLDPEKTLLISCSSKMLPVRGFGKMYKKINKNGEGNYYMTSNPKTIVKIIQTIGNKFDIIVLDDFQFVMGDYYMQKAAMNISNFDIFKEIGGYVGLIMNELDKLSDKGKTIIVSSHYEVIENDSGLTMIKPKTAGKAVDNYLTLEGRFDVIIYSVLDVDGEGNVDYRFITKPIGSYHNIRAPYGMFDKAIYPNDMGIILDEIKKYYEESD